MEGIIGDPSSTSFAKDDAEKSLDVLDCFGQMQNSFDAKRFVLLPRKSPKLLLSGVEVSVSLDALIEDGTENKPLVGGLVFRMTKPVDGETSQASGKRQNMGLYVATGVFLAIQRHYESSGIPSFRHCWSADVQATEIHKAPSTFKKRINDLDAACQMIAAIWPSIQE